MNRLHFQEQPIAKKREIRGLYLTSLGHGPMASVIIIFIQLIIVKQTKYLAAESSEGENWIEWRDSYIDGSLCNGSGLPHPKGSQNAYSRPEEYSSNCVWFPSDKTVPGLGIQYTNTIVYGTAFVLFITGVMLVILGPFSDYGYYRRQLLTGCVLIWVPMFSLLIFCGDPDVYIVALCLTVIGSVAFFFGLKSPLAAYLPLLINANYELVELRRKLDGVGGGQTGRQSSSTSIGIELTNHSFDESRVDASTSTPVVETDGDQLIESGMFPSDAHDQKEEDDTDGLMQQYHELHEAIAGKTAITESACFIAGQLICLLPQFGILLAFHEEDDSKKTIGERVAILVATVWGAGVNYLGLTRLKDRQGPPFPPGNKLMIGIRRSLKTLKLLHNRLPRLLCLMIGRMLFWLAIQTVLAMSTLFFEREFSLGATDLAPIVLLYLAVGVPSAILTSWMVQKCAGKILVIFRVYCVLVMSLPVYMWIGVKQRFEIYVLMCLSAILVAPFPALVRAMMSDMIPNGYTSTIMSFEGLLENCTTWIGPLVVGGILDLTDSLRFGLFSLEMFMVAGLPFVFYANVEKGREQRLEVEQWNQEHDESDSQVDKQLE